MIGFVSQFFHRHRFPQLEHARSSACADGGVGAPQQLPRAKANGWMPPRGVRHDDTDSPGEGGFADRRHRPKSGNPGVASLTSPRNFINAAAAAFEGAGRLCASGHPIRFFGRPSRRTRTMLTSSTPASARVDADAARPKSSFTIFMKSAGWWQRTGAIPRSGS